VKVWKAQFPRLGFFIGPHLGETNLSGADLRRAKLGEANLSGAILTGANLSGQAFSGVNFSEQNLSEANLSETDLAGIDCSKANLDGATLRDANLTGSSICGIAAWDVKLTADTRQKNLIITPPGEAVIMVDKTPSVSPKLRRCHETRRFGSLRVSFRSVSVAGGRSTRDKEKKRGKENISGV
jgi:hypothetical protein